MSVASYWNLPLVFEPARQPGQALMAVSWWKTLALVL
jgi:hypothetical protein